MEGVEVTIKRVPELMPEEVARKASAKLDQEAPIATNLAEFLSKSGDPRARRTKTPQTSAIRNALIFHRMPCGLVVSG